MTMSAPSRYPSSTSARPRRRSPVHLIGAFVADQRRARADGIAERTVKGRRIFGRIGHDLNTPKPAASRPARIAPTRPSIMSDGAMNVASGFGLDQRLAHQDSDGLVVENDAIAQQAIVAVAGIGIERHIAEHADIRTSFLMARIALQTRFSALSASEPVWSRLSGSV